MSSTSFKIESNIIKFDKNFKGFFTRKIIKQLEKHIANGKKEILIINPIGESYNYKIEDLCLKGIENLQLTNYYKKISAFPPNLKELNTGDCFDQPIGTGELILPDSIENLVFGFSFNNKIEKYPANLKNLEFGKKFNQELINLPNELTNLYVGTDFDQSLDSLPNSLKLLSFMGPGGAVYDKQLDNLPTGLEVLILSGRFNQTIDLLPANLKTLYLNILFNKPINNLPSNLKQIFFPKKSKFNQSIDNIPDSVIEITLPEKYEIEIKKLPANLKKILIDKEYIHLTSFNENFSQFIAEKEIELVIY